jgi:hypothetical protein
MRRLHPAFLGFLVLSGAAAGCTRDVIPNTDVEDTSSNREVIEFCERYRMAVEERNVPALMRLASQRYYDDNGTPSGMDDVDYDGLAEKLNTWREGVLDVRYEIRYRRVTFHRERILVDYTYTGSFRVSSVSGERWARRLADNRLILQREGEEEEFRILSGM